MSRKFALLFFLLAGFLFVSLNGCNKKDDGPQIKGSPPADLKKMTPGGPNNPAPRPQ